MSYYIRMKDDTIKPVDRANPFIYEGIQLFTWYHKGLNEFQVVEATTGSLLSRCPTEEGAIIIAKEYITQVGFEETKAKIIEAQKKINFNPPNSIQNTEVL